MVSTGLKISGPVRPGCSFASLGTGSPGRWAAENRAGVRKCAGTSSGRVEGPVRLMSKLSSGYPNNGKKWE